MNKLQQILERASAGAYGEDSADIGKMAGILMAATFDHGAGPFICGTVGEPDYPGGLYEGYSICPMYGADHRCTGVFMRAEGAKK